jgi:hypothetical protein
MSEQKPKRQYRRRKVAAPELESIPAAESIAPVAEAPKAPEGPKTLLMTGNELTQMKLAQAELRIALAEREAAKLRKMFILAKIDPKGVVEKQEKNIEEKDEALKAAQHKFTLIRIRVGGRLGVDMAQCGFDPDTGEVVPRPA